MWWWCSRGCGVGGNVVVSGGVMSRVLFWCSGGFGVDGVVYGGRRVND